LLLLAEIFAFVFDDYKRQRRALSTVKRFDSILRGSSSGANPNPRALNDKN
jgi:hypothetical protein